jgi:hypothetical protein
MNLQVNSEESETIEEPLPLHDDVCGDFVIIIGI